MVTNKLADCMRAFCAVVVHGDGMSEPEQQLDALRQEVGVLLDKEWPVDGDAAVREFFAVPNHRFACTDLDYHRFGTQPLMIGTHPLHIFHILEAFSRTNPTRYAAIWLPLLDILDVVASAELAPDPSLSVGLGRARSHLRQQLEPVPPSPSAIANLDAQIDGVMQNLLGTFPGLHSMVQQIMTTAAADPNADGGLGGVFGQIQGILTPLLTQAAASATAQDPSLTPAIGQILSGFTALTQALAPSPPGGGVGVGQQMEESSMTE